MKKVLTYRGSQEFPAVVLLLTLQDYKFEPNHEVYGCYEFNKKVYASLSTNLNQQGRCNAKVMGDDPEVPVKTGVDKGETPIWCLFTGKNYLKINIISQRVDKGLTYATGVVTREAIEVQDNLYYSVPISWPSVSYEITLEDKPISGELWRYIYWINYLPKFAASVSLELAMGTGRLIVPRNLSSAKYFFSAEDYKRGYVEFKLAATPLVNAVPPKEGVSKIIKLTFPKS